MQFNNYAQYWCATMIEALVKKGVNHFFIGPGSRSTPLVSALARNPQAKVFVAIDERSVGFMALGYSKAAQTPSAIIVTSGTAGANLYPAIVEAFLSEIPLMVLTADRPYELRDCGANQTIVQTNMFASHVKKSFDLAPPSHLIPIDFSYAIFDQAYRLAQYAPKGPIHINVQLREPLANIPCQNEASWQSKEIHEHGESTLKEIKTVTSLCKIPAEFFKKRGLIAVGELVPSDVQEKIVKLSELLSWPIYADVTSNMRFFHHENILHHGDLAILNQHFLKQLATECVIKFGGRIVSKRFWSLIEQNGFSEMVAISESPQRIDHVARFSHWCVPHLSSWLDDACSLIAKENVQPKYKEPVPGVYEAITKQIENFLECEKNNEAYFASKLVALISEPVNLFLSSSMPIRDVDQFAKSSSINIDVYANRGASGIDGVTSSAIGVSVAKNKPTILLIGDVAFLHDTNALMSVSLAPAPLLIVIFNNSGGGIFHFLPIAQESDVVTPYLDTPHNVSLGYLCRAHHLEHHVVYDAHSFDGAIRNFFSSKKTIVLEVMIDREKNISAHKEICKAIYLVE